MATRSDIYTLTELPPDPATMTMRECVEWHKRIVLSKQELGVLSPKDIEYIQSQWLVMTQAVAVREGVPQGIVAELVDRTALSEIKLLATALEEGEQAVKPKVSSDED